MSIWNRDIVQRLLHDLFLYSPRLFQKNDTELVRFPGHKGILFIYDPEIYNERTTDKQFLYKLKLETETTGQELMIVYLPELAHKYSITLNRIKYRLQDAKARVRAKKCQIRDLTSVEYKNFINEFHIQGSIVSSIKYGLFKDDLLLAAMSFNKSRYNKDYEYEMGRYCVRPGFVIHGNASRLLHHFIREKDPKSIITYCDYRWSSGRVYEAIGFKLLHDSACGFFWAKDGQMYNRRGWWKARLPEKLDHFDPNLSAHNNMRANGFVKIYDIGQRTYVWHKEA